MRPPPRDEEAPLTGAQLHPFYTKKLPATLTAFLIAGLALAGVSRDFASALSKPKGTRAEITGKSSARGRGGGYSGS